MAAYRLGVTITPHGFGHAARAAAVMDALSARLDDVEFVIATTVPEWFFRTSMEAAFSWHSVRTDIGLFQQSSLQEDIPATIEALDDFYPLSPVVVGEVAELFSECQLVLSDIAPLGIVVAERIGISSVLIENFTWDWIYEGYVNQWPGFEPHIHTLRDLYSRATYHIQAEPYCGPCVAGVTVAPIARALRGSGKTLRRTLQVTEKDRLVLVTMGGVGDQSLAMEPLLVRDDFVFILPGYAEQLTVQDNLRRMPCRSALYHPDCVAEADAIIGKAGYSTVAEVYQAGTPFGYITRPSFRESAYLAAFIKQHIPSRHLSAVQWESGGWLGEIDQLTSMPRKKNRQENGADQAATFLCRLLAPERILP